MEKHYRMKAEPNSYKLSGDSMSFSLVKKFVKKEFPLILVCSMIISTIGYFGGSLLALVAFVALIVPGLYRLKKFISKN